MAKTGGVVGANRHTLNGEDQQGAGALDRPATNAKGSTAGQMGLPRDARRRILIASAMSMPTRVLQVLAPGSSSDVQRVLRIELSRFIGRSAAARYATVGEAWNAWIGEREDVSLFPVRCPDCKDGGFSSKPYKGILLKGTRCPCGRCGGRRNITVRQRVVRSPVPSGRGRR
jgi:hypothetical protein